MKSLKRFSSFLLVGTTFLALGLHSRAADGFSVNPSDLVTPNSRYGSAYQEMNTRITQVHVVKNLPFFKLTARQRLQRVGGYLGDVRHGRPSRVRSSLARDFTGGGLLQDVGVAATTSILTRMAQGSSVDESVSETWEYVSSTPFFFGQILGGISGAAVGAMVPVPLIGGLAGQMIGGIPMMTGAMLGGTSGYQAISHLTQGEKAGLVGILKEMDYVNLAGQSVGSTVGMTLGAFVPVPGLGPIIGGVIGGNLGLRVVALLRRSADGGACAVAALRPKSLPGGETGEACAASESAQSLTSDVVVLTNVRDGAYECFVAAQARGETKQAQEALELYALTSAAIRRVEGGGGTQ